MSQEQMLVAAVGALWAVLTGLAGGVIKWLVADRKSCDDDWGARLTKAETECINRIAKLEVKLDEAGSLLQRQADSQQRQIEVQQRLTEQQQQTIAALQLALSGPPSRPGA